MAEMPERIWAEPSRAGRGLGIGEWIDRPGYDPDATEFIRADLVDELVKALEGIHNTWPGTPQGNAAADALTRIKGDGK